MTDSSLHSLAGTALPEGSFTITAEEEARLIEVVGGSARGEGIAHPLWAYIATQRGIGIGVTEICALADFDVNDGPMLGSSHLEYRGPIRIGVRYRVTGEVLGLVRKQGRSGTFDVLEFREDLRHEDGELLAASTSTYILPRRSA